MSVVMFSEQTNSTRMLDDDYAIREISTLTDSQEVTLSILSVVTGALSIMGSFTIVSKVIRNRENPNTGPYDRIMLGLSSCDMITSATYAFAPLMLPKETSQRPWAAGNDATCSFLGFLYQFAFSAIVYNGVLSLYYLLTVRFGVRRRDFARKYEFWLHVTTLSYFLGTAIVGAVLGVFSELEITQGCWIAEYPEGCELNGDCVGQYIGWVFGGLPTIITFLGIIINNLVIFCYVRRKLNVPANNNSWESSRIQTQQAQVREVATQGFLYVGTFLLAYLPAFTLRVLESLGLNAADEASIYWMLALDAFLRPFQGFFNMFVYNRPNYVRFRNCYPEHTRMWAIRRACTDSEIPRLADNMISSGTTRNKSGQPASNSSGSGRPKPKPSPLKWSGNSGSRFSSSLGVVHEVSQEDSSVYMEGFPIQPHVHHIQEEKEPEAIHTSSTTPDSQAASRHSDHDDNGDDNDDDDDDVSKADSLVLEAEEAREIFRSSGSAIGGSIRRIGMDGDIEDLSDDSK